MSTENERTFHLDQYLTLIVDLLAKAKMLDRSADLIHWDSFSIPAIESMKSDGFNLSSVDESSIMQASRSVGWALQTKSQKGSFRNQYEEIAYQMALSNSFPFSLRNLAASLVFAEKRAAAWCGLNASDRHLGVAGEKIAVRVKLKAKHKIESDYAKDGVIHSFEFIAESGIVYRWDCYGAAPKLPPKSSWMQLAGRVKGHGQDGKRLITQLTHVKILPDRQMASIDE